MEIGLKMEYACKLYERLIWFYNCSEYAEFRKSCIRVFDEEVGKKEITAAKKLDYVLWSMGKDGIFIPW